MVLVQKWQTFDYNRFYGDAGTEYLRKSLNVNKINNIYVAFNLPCAVENSWETNKSLATLPLLFLFTVTKLGDIPYMIITHHKILPGNTFRCVPETEL